MQQQVTTKGSKASRPTTDLCDRVVGHLALVQGIHEGEHPRHIEGELFGEEVVGNRVQPPDIGHVLQVGGEAVKVGRHSAALPGAPAEEGDALRMGAQPAVDVPAAPIVCFVIFLEKQKNTALNKH